MGQKPESLTFSGLPVGALPESQLGGSFLWPIATDYEVSFRTIEAVGFKEYSTPLDDPELFTSLARLHSNGESTKERILGWIREHGLLYRRQLDKGPYDPSWVHEHFCGDPISLQDFRKEAEEAYNSLTLYEALLRRDADAIRERIGFVPETAREYPYNKGLSTYVEVDKQAVRMDIWGDTEVTDKRAFTIAVQAIQDRICEKMVLVVNFGSNFKHPYPLKASERPIPVMMPADLLSAAWLQFCLYFADFNRNWRLCEACHRPFRLQRSDQVTCPKIESCRKARQRRQGQ